MGEFFANFQRKHGGRSQNTIPIASTQVAIKGIVQHSRRVAVAGLVSKQLEPSGVGRETRTRAHARPK